jgi:hypothetical protein
MGRLEGKRTLRPPKTSNTFRLALLALLGVGLVVPGDLLHCQQGVGDTADAEHTASDSLGSYPDTTQINTSRMIIIGGALVGTMAGIMIYQQNGWWKDNRRSFHFREDLQYGRSVDKLGHFYGANAATFIFSRSFQWAGMRERPSLWYGAGCSLLFQTYIEVQDGFSAWGFDRVDFAADVLGAFYPVAQHYVPPLRELNMKFSYHPSNLINEPGGVGFRGQQHILFDDYEGQTIWLSLNLNSVLPSAIEPYWPDWLAVAAGYGVRDVATPNPYSILLLSLDYDMTKIIPADTWFLKTLGEVLNFIHFPAPAVQISPHAIWYGFYF